MSISLRSQCVIWAATLLLVGGCAKPGPDEQPPPPPTAEQPAPVSHSPIHFVEGYEEGLRVAREEGKPMLLFFTAGWCEYCHRMAEEAFVEQRVVYLADHFVCVLIDADSESRVCQEFRVRAYPTIQFLSPRGIPLNRLTGKQPGDRLAVEMQAALQAIARRVGEPAQTILR